MTWLRLALKEVKRLRPFWLEYSAFIGSCSLCLHIRISAAYQIGTSSSLHYVFQNGERSEHQSCPAFERKVGYSRYSNQRSHEDSLEYLSCQTNPALDGTPTVNHSVIGWAHNLAYLNFLILKVSYDSVTPVL